MHKHTLQLIIATLNAGGKAQDSFVLFKAGWNELEDGLRYFDDLEGWCMGRIKLSTAVPAAAPGTGYRDTAQPMPAISLSAKIQQKSSVRSAYA